MNLRSTSPDALEVNQLGRTIRIRLHSGGSIEGSFREIRFFLNEAVRLEEPFEEAIEITVRVQGNLIPVRVGPNDQVEIDEN